VPLGHLCLALVVGILLGQGLVQMLIALKPQRKRYKASAVLVVATAAYYSVQVKWLIRRATCPPPPFPFFHQSRRWQWDTRREVTRK
jgi:hypothetical protein